MSRATAQAPWRARRALWRAGRTADLAGTWRDARPPRATGGDGTGGRCIRVAGPARPGPDGTESARHRAARALRPRRGALRSTTGVKTWGSQCIQINQGVLVSTGISERHRRVSLSDVPVFW